MKLTLIDALALAGAGGLGTLCRFWMSRFPQGTLIVNVLGSLAIGLLFGALLVRGQLDSRMRLIATVGFLGGFTTFSSFAMESVGYAQERQWGALAAYLGVTVCAGLGACAIGLSIGRRL